MAPESYERLLGPLPRRPPKGGVPDLAGHDPTRLGMLSPYPVYAWMGWVQILSPTAGRFEGMQPLLAESLGAIRALARVAPTLASVGARGPATRKPRQRPGRRRQIQRTRFDASQIDAFDLDDLIHRYKRSARELWKFCASRPESVAWAIEDARSRADEIDWWAAGEPRRHRRRDD